MTSIKSFLLIGAVLAATTLAAAAQASPDGSFTVAQAESCAGWFDTCVSRCSGSKDLNCNRAFCAGKLDACRRTGCFTEGAHFGHAKHCGLAR